MRRLGVKLRSPQFLPRFLIGKFSDKFGNSHKSLCQADGRFKAPEREKSPYNVQSWNLTNFLFATATTKKPVSWKKSFPGNRCPHLFFYYLQDVLLQHCHVRLFRHKSLASITQFPRQIEHFQKQSGHYSNQFGYFSNQNWTILNLNWTPFHVSLTLSLAYPTKEQQKGNTKEYLEATKGFKSSYCALRKKSFTNSYLTTERFVGSSYPM